LFNREHYKEIALLLGQLRSDVKPYRSVHYSTIIDRFVKMFAEDNEFLVRTSLDGIYKILIASNR
jgi:hypothetical protein